MIGIVVGSVVATAAAGGRCRSGKKETRLASTACSHPSPSISAAGPRTPSSMGESRYWHCAGLAVKAVLGCSGLFEGRGWMGRREVASRTWRWREVAGRKWRWVPWFCSDVAVCCGFAESGCSQCRGGIRTDADARR